MFHRYFCRQKYFATLSKQPCVRPPADAETLAPSLIVVKTSGVGVDPVALKAPPLEASLTFVNPGSTPSFHF